MAARTLHLDLDAFFVEVCRQRHPELRGVEFLVVGGRREERGVVQSASYAERKFGVRAGIPIAEAARRCPQATFFAVLSVTTAMRRAQCWLSFADTRRPW
jgi:DNA polymerase-4